jgi:DNA modification methylase
LPNLTWTSKRIPEQIPAQLVTDSLVYPGGKGYPQANPLDRLILGDNLKVMSALLDEFEGRLDLIYADPPFFTNRHFQARVGKGEDSRRPREWQLADGYPDTWQDLDAYLDMLYPRLWMMHRLLSPTGTLYLHLDWHANAYARLLLDEIFGAERLLNEIVWVYHGPSPIRSAFNRKHDTILVYTKSKKYTFNADAVRQPYNSATVRTFEASTKAGFGKLPDLARGKVPEDWWYFPVVARLHNERTGYPTQKPAALLERVILASSNPGDWVADFFCGSGTLPAIASRLGRHFIANDVTWRAVHTTRARLVEQASEAFTLQVEKSRALPSPTEWFGKPAPLRIGNAVKLPAELLDDVAYWEVDPAWDGSLYYSRNQALHSRRRGGTIEQELTLYHEDRVLNLVRVRLVTIDGEVYAWTI